MEYGRKLIALSLVVSMPILAVADTAAALGQPTMAAPLTISQTAHALGVGADVKVKLVDGRKLRGSILDTKEEELVLALKEPMSAAGVPYNTIKELKPTKLRYSAKGNPDPTQARRVLVGLGVGKHVVVKLENRKEYHGHLMSLETDHFSILPDRTNQPVRISYIDVRHAEKNLSLGATVAIVIGVVVGAAVLLALIASSDNQSN